MHSLCGVAEVAAATTLSDMVYDEFRYGEVFAVVGPRPGMEFDANPAHAVHASGCRVTVTCSQIRSRHYRLVRDRYVGRARSMSQELQVLRARQRELQEELWAIKRSGLWKVACLYRSLRKKVS